jgi:anti-sigma-K factor RskA
VNEDLYRDWIPAYALGILEEEERRALEAHLPDCPECQAELRAFQAVSAQLSMAVPVREPPARLKQAILQQVHQQQAQSPRPAQAPRQAASPAPAFAAGQAAQTGARKAQGTRQPGFSGWLNQLLTPLARPAFVLVGMLVAAVLLVSNLLMWQRLNHVETEYNSQPVVVDLTATKYAPNAGGVLVLRPLAHEGTLIADGLPELPKDKQYQLWLIQDGKRTSGGVFSVQAEGYGVLVVKSSRPMADYQSFGITIEPYGGSPGPTGDKVLGGKL